MYGTVKPEELGLGFEEATVLNLMNFPQRNTRESNRRVLNWAL